MLFPKEIVNKSGITIVNFHDSLLPKYAGMNAPTWAIFEDEKETGITWHYVTEGIDDGMIICQEKCEIVEDERAYQLASKLMTLGIDLFSKCIESILMGRIETTEQDKEENRKVFYAKDMPQNGMFSLQDDPDAVYRLCRSVDYGKSAVSPKLRIQNNGCMNEVKRYKVCKEWVNKDNTVIYKLKDGRYLYIYV